MKILSNIFLFLKYAFIISAIILTGALIIDAYKCYNINDKNKPDTIEATFVSNKIKNRKNDAIVLTSDSLLYIIKTNDIVNYNIHNTYTVGDKIEINNVNKITYIEYIQMCITLIFILWVLSMISICIFDALSDYFKLKSYEQNKFKKFN